MFVRCYHYVVNKDEYISALCCGRLNERHLGEGHLGDDRQHDLLALGRVRVLDVLVQPGLQRARRLASRVLSARIQADVTARSQRASTIIQYSALEALRFCVMRCINLRLTYFKSKYDSKDCLRLGVPRAGCGVVRMDPLRYGRMSYKATKPGIVSVLYLSMFFYCVGDYLGPFLCIVSFH